MSNGALITDLHFKADSEGHVGLRLTLLGNTTTLQMNRHVAVIALAELLTALSESQKVLREQAEVEG